MINTIPGTTLPLEKRAFDNAFSVISPAIEVTGGLTLSQVCGISGLENSTIQNWVKRGWVPSPLNKKYEDVHVARILIINILRSVLTLESIVALMRYVNGEVNDRSDDIISDTELYNYLCATALRAEQQQSYTDENIDSIVDSVITGYCGPLADSAERLGFALKIMARAYISARFKAKAETMLENMSN